MNVGDTERGSPPPPLVSLPQQGENLSLSPPRRSRSRSLQFRRSATGASNRSVENSSRRSNASKRSREKIQATETAARLELNRHLANLQLPRMPASIVSHGGEPIKDGDGSTQSHHDQQSTSEPPTIRILVVADIDLDSASALAESALNNSHEENLLKGVDLCIACGPFCQEDDLRFYYQGRQRRRHMARHSKAHHAKTHSAAPIWRGGNGNALLPLPPMPQHMHSKRQNTSRTMQTPCAPAPTSSYPFKRTKEETAALEGLMTAALSQLESIVCRVVFVPGKSDPVTTITSSLTSVAYTKERRLTPNSRNIHQHWIPLCPGLGCAGLLYVDGQKLQQQPPPLADDDDDEGDDDDETDTSHLLREDSSVSYDREDHPSSVPVSPAASPDLLPLSNDIDNSSDVTTFEQRVQDYG